MKTDGALKNLFNGSMRLLFPDRFCQNMISIRLPDFVRKWILASNLRTDSMLSFGGRLEHILPRYRRPIILHMLS